MKNFIKEVGATFYSSVFYQKIKDEKVDKSIIFLLKVSLLIGICLGVLGIIFSLIFFNPAKKEVKNFIDLNFPSDLLVTVKDGKMTTNTNEPFFVKLLGASKESNSKENMLVLLPKENVDVSLLTKYDTFFAMASDGVIGEESNGSQIRIFKYGNSSFVASKEIALETIDTFFPFFLLFFAIAIIPFIIFFVIITIIFHLIWLFFVALLIWGYLKLKKLDISYKQSYKIGMYTIVPLLFIEIIATPLSLSGKFFTIAVIFIVLLFCTHDWQKENILEDVKIEEIKNI